MREIKAIIRPERLDDVLQALREAGRAEGIAISTVHVIAVAAVQDPAAQPGTWRRDLLKLELVVPEAVAGEVVTSIRNAAHTGHFGDGKIFVLPVEDVVRIRTGEQGVQALSV